MKRVDVAALLAHLERCWDAESADYAPIHDRIETSLLGTDSHDAGEQEDIVQLKEKAQRLEETLKELMAANAKERQQLGPLVPSHRTDLEWPPAASSETTEGLEQDSVEQTTNAELRNTITSNFTKILTAFAEWKGIAHREEAAKKLIEILKDAQGRSNPAKGTTKSSSAKRRARRKRRIAASFRSKLHS